MSADFLTIGTLAEHTNTKVVTIRYYEKIGLLPKPQRTGGNYRMYDRAHLNRLSYIRRCRDLGFTLEQVREMLDLSEQKQKTCKQVDHIARTHLDDVERKIADLEKLAVELRRMIKRCSGGTIADCRIIEALSVH